MKNQVTGFSADMMMLGTEVSQPIDVLFGAALRGEGSEDPGTYLKHLCEVLWEVHALAASKLRSQMQYQKCAYDLKLQEYHYEVGDLVFRRREAQKVGNSKKLITIWIGPLLVVEVINPALYRVHDRKHEYVLHHDLLKCCEDHVITLWLRKMRHELMDLDTTIAYDEAEQEEDPLPTGKNLPTGKKSANEIQGTNVRDTENGSSTVIQVSGDSGPEEDDLEGSAPEGSDPRDDLIIPTDSLDKVEGRPANVSWIDEAKDLGLKKLFNESPTVHIYAKPWKLVKKERRQRKGIALKNQSQEQDDNVKFLLTCRTMPCDSVAMIFVNSVYIQRLY